MDRVISATLEKVSKSTLRNASNWYKVIHRHCKVMSDTYNLPYWKVAGVISALSPNNKFKRNLLDAENLIKYGESVKVCTYNDNKTKALKIIEARNVSEVYKVFTGRKTLSFFDNIVNPRSERVTVDLWMIRVFDLKGSLTPKRYGIIEKAIQDYAAKIKVRPMELQAMLWVAQRGEVF